MNLVVQVSCLLLWIATGSYAQNHLQHGHEQLRLGVSKPPHPLKKVAIIGAGSAGTSTAHYLSRYAAANVTIFERNSWIGGRSTTVDAYGDPSQPVELGASIFVEANLNLVQAVKDLNLTTNHLHAHDDGATGRIGIYDGSRFVYEADLAGTSYWDLAKLFWRYGLSPYRAQKLMKRVVGQLLTMYDAPIFPFTSLSQAAYDVGLTAVTAATGAQYLRENEVGDLFSNEIVQAATRVNYAQNLNEIHGLEALVCLAADNAKSVVGGNWKIFAGMAKSSTVLLDTEVHSISSKHGKHILTYTKGFRHAGALQEDQFDEVVLAAPYHQAGIEFDPELAHIPDDVPYVHLEVTLFTSTLRLSPLFFDMDASAVVPDVVLTTLPPENSSAPQPNFFSISMLRIVHNRSEGRREYLYKVFSREPLDSAFLTLLLGEPAEDVVTWKHTKSWLSYPHLPPRITFEEILLDRGMWYTGGIESFISTMETSSLMGHNVARLLADSWKQERL